MESLDSDINRIAKDGDENRQLPMQGKEIQRRKVEIEMALLQQLYKWRYDIGSW